MVALAGGYSSLDGLPVWSSCSFYRTHKSTPAGFVTGYKMKEARGLYQPSRAPARGPADRVCLCLVQSWKWHRASMVIRTAAWSEPSGKACVTRTTRESRGVTPR